MTTLLILLLTLSNGTGQATLIFESPEACEETRQRIENLAVRAMQYVPFQVSLASYCIPKEE